MALETSAKAIRTPLQVTRKHSFEIYLGAISYIGKSDNLQNTIVRVPFCGGFREVYQALWQEYTRWHRFCAVSRERWIGKRWNVGTMGTSDRKWREREKEKKKRIGKWNGNKAWIIRSAAAVVRWSLISFGEVIVCGTVVTIISHFCHRTLSVFTSAL